MTLSISHSTSNVVIICWPQIDFCWNEYECVLVALWCQRVLYSKGKGHCYFSESKVSDKINFYNDFFLLNCEADIKSSCPKHLPLILSFFLAGCRLNVTSGTIEWWGDTGCRTCCEQWSRCPDKTKFGKNLKFSSKSFEMAAPGKPKSFLEGLSLKPLTQENMLYYYAPLAGAASYTTLSVSLSNPNLLRRLEFLLWPLTMVASVIVCYEMNLQC